MLKLSHTAKELYMRCPKAYYIHYFLNLRKKTVGSALPFGSAIDKALDVLLHEKDVEKAKTTFNENWDIVEINKKKIKISEAGDKIRFYKSDTDPNMFSEGEEVTPYESLRRKAFLFLEQYSKDVLPRIKQMGPSQRSVSVSNSDGDIIKGFIDFECIWEDGSRIIFDNKTSSRPYKEDIIETEAYQLAIYAEAQPDHDKVGYIVIDKNIRKIKEPKVKIQVITGKISEELRKKTLDQYDHVLYNIRKGHFPSNAPNCDAYGEECTCVLFDREGYTAFDYVGDK